MKKTSLHPLEIFRQRFGYSRKALADQVGTTRMSIYRIEVREQTPSLDMVVRLLKVARERGAALSADDFLPDGGR